MGPQNWDYADLHPMVHKMLWCRFMTPKNLRIAIEAEADVSMKEMGTILKRRCRIRWAKKENLTLAERDLLEIIYG